MGYIPEAQAVSQYEIILSANALADIRELNLNTKEQIMSSIREFTSLGVTKAPCSSVSVCPRLLVEDHVSALGAKHIISLGSITITDCSTLRVSMSYGNSHFNSLRKALEHIQLGHFQTSHQYTWLKMNKIIQSQE